MPGFTPVEMRGIGALMIRKLLLIAAVMAVPLGGAVVTTVVSAGVAGALPPPPFNCKTSSGGPLVFPAPGISETGTVTAAATSTLNIPQQTLPTSGTCPGPANFLSPLAIVVPNVSCGGPNNPIPGCAFGLYYDDSASWLQALIPNLWTYINPAYTKIHVGTTIVNYRSMSTASAWINPGGSCGTTELGIKINGNVQLPVAYSPDPTQLRFCLSSDTGTSTTGDFTNDFDTELAGGAPTMTIATASFDTSLSKVKIT
jgi:hypothetical protein